MELMLFFKTFSICGMELDILSFGFKNNVHIKLIQ